MSPRSFAIPSIGALGVVLTACSGVEDADSAVGLWRLAESVTDGEVLTYPRSYVIDNGYGYSYDIDIDRSIELHALDEAFDVVSRFTYHVVYTYGTEKTSWGGTTTSIGKAWLLGDREYGIVVPGGGLDLTCAGADDELDCDVADGSGDTQRYAR